MGIGTHYTSMEVRECQMDPLAPKEPVDPPGGRSRKLRLSVIKVVCQGQRRREVPYTETFP